jgi:hypothetical protein
MSASRKRSTLKKKFPITENGGIFFFLPSNLFSEYDEPDEFEGDETKQIELTLTEIFNYYARKYTDKPTEFEQMHNQLHNLGLRGYIAFLNDM